MKLLVEVVVFITFVSQFDVHWSQDVCSTQKTCSQCITTHPDCVWCDQVVERTDTNYEKLRNTRCGMVEQMNTICHPSNIVNPGSNLTKITDKPLGPTLPNKEEVQVRPQKVSIHLRPKESFSFRLHYKQAKDYPVDLYFLMDLSFSMKDDKENLEKLGDDLVRTMKNVTSNFRIGFGSFVDKRALPFTSTVPANLENPCRPTASCSPPYEYQNQMSLSDRADLFTDRVRKTQISGNLDSPEGTLSAIMQILICQTQIGWRSKSRKLLLLATDGSFHIAGDGKLGGIVIPNDEICHLNNEGLYTASLDQDYPSVAQIRRQIRNSKVNLIMAVTKPVLDLYRQLSRVLEGSSFEELRKDSSNVVELIKAQYEAITDSVEMSDNSTSHVQITYFSTCNDGRYEERKICRGLKVGSNVTFEVRIQVSSCPSDWKDKTQIIQIYPVGLNESTIIELNLICECDCEKRTFKEADRSHCSGGNGTLQCGICSCNSDRYGRDCECSKKKGVVQDSALCIRPNDTKQCSDRGTCRCGQCICDLRENPEEVISGAFCELENYSCNKINGKFCNGNGICAFQKCNCNQGWTGDTCECTNATCFGKKHDVLCDGHGSCDCGRCQCEDLDNEFYYGTYCEIKKTSTDLCNDWNECFTCLTNKKDSNKDDQHGDCDAVCTQNNNNAGYKSEGSVACHFKTEKVTCNYVLKFNPDMDKPKIEYKCPEDKTLLIALGTVGGTAVVGLLILLLWKILTMVHDGREYARFQQEQKKAVWITGNPIYKGATSEFQNPTFGHRLSRAPE